MKNVVIRKMTMADYGAVMELWKNTEHVGLSEADSRENIRRFLKRNPGLSTVAVCGREIVGAVLCGHDGRRGFIHHLAVRPDCRRRGTGRRIVETCLGKLRARGITRCHLFLFTRNTEGRLFWEKNGWLQREDIVIMSRNL